jgi:hypothetical protein
MALFIIHSSSLSHYHFARYLQICESVQAEELEKAQCFTKFWLKIMGGHPNFSYQFLNSSSQDVIPEHIVMSLPKW